MQTEPNITFRNIDGAPEVRDHIRQRIVELGKYHPGIIGCDVVVEAPSQKQRSGGRVDVHVTVFVPGNDISVTRGVARSQEAKALNLAIHETFDAARSALKSQKKKMGAVEVKRQPLVQRGTIDRLVPDEGFGFITGDHGREVFFQRDTLTKGDWEKLAPGTRVRFTEDFGEKGYFASHVAVLD